jgi:hypothetical protein
MYRLKKDFPMKKKCTFKMPKFIEFDNVYESENNPTTLINSADDETFVKKPYYTHLSSPLTDDEFIIPLTTKTKTKRKYRPFTKKRNRRLTSRSYSRSKSKRVLF